MDYAKIEQLLTHIILFRDDDDNKYTYLEKYDKKWLLSILAEGKNIKLIQEKFKEYHENKGIDLIDFIKIFLTSISHTMNQTLYMTIALLDLFKDICETYDLQDIVKASDLVNYIVESYLQKNVSPHGIPTKKVPNKRNFELKKDDGNPKIREIDYNCPTIIGDTNFYIRRLVRTKILTDSSHHSNYNIKRAVFGSEIKKIFTLDSLADNISIYSLNCQLEKKIIPKSFKGRTDILIMDFDWSNRQLRIGACLKDFLLIFWDANDNFEFEKSFSTASMCSEYQTKIWYIEFLNRWYTTDKTNVLNLWDIEKESKIDTYHIPRIKKSIVDVVPMEILKVIAVASMDKTLVVWDPYNAHSILTMDFSNGGIHTAVFSNSYQILVTAGYENTIKLWHIHPLYFDESLKGVLTGHQSMVTAIQIIEKTPMIVSATDNGQIKIWDIRNMNCIQTVDLGIKIAISKLIDLFIYGKLCFLGIRVNIIEFDDSYNIQSTLKSDEKLWSTNVEYNYLENELVICTRKDIRFIDCDTGRIKRIYTGLLSNEDDDIVAFKILQESKKIILCDHKGNMTLNNYCTGEKMKDLTSHSAQISAIKLDYTNKLIVSSSYDSSLFIQKYRKNEFILKRKIISNNNSNKEIYLMDVSVYHNLIVTCTSNNLIYLWDYEYIKLIASIQLDKEAEPTSLQFINGYGILIIGCNNGKIHFLAFKRKDIQLIIIHRVAVINLNILLAEYAKYERDPNTIIEYKEKIKLEILEDRNQNAICCVNFSAMRSRNKKKLSKVPSPRKNQGMVLSGSKTMVITTKEPEDLLPKKFAETDEIKKTYIFEELSKEHTTEYATKFLLHIPNIFNSKTKKIDEARLYIGLNKGTVHCYSITKLFTLDHIDMIPHANTRSNYNPERLITENFDESIQNLKIYNYDIYNPPEIFLHRNDMQMPELLVDLRAEFLYQFYAHKDLLTTLSYIHCPGKNILTSSIDCYVKIWDLKGSLLCCLNINHPLPILWNMKFDKLQSMKSKIVFGIKSIHGVLERYSNVLSPQEEKQINIGKFIGEIQKNLIGANDQNQMTNDKYNGNRCIPEFNLFTKAAGSIETFRRKSAQQKIILMKDEYSPRDLHYEESKKIFQKEMQGPTLKEMEIEKRFNLAQKQWKQEQVKENPKDKDGMKELTKSINSFLSPYILGENQGQSPKVQNELYSGRIKKLARKLDSSIVSDLDKERLLAASTKRRKTIKTQNSRQKMFTSIERMHVEKLDYSASSDESQKQKNHDDSKKLDLHEKKLSLDFMHLSPPEENNRLVKLNSLPLSSRVSSSKMKFCVPSITSRMIDSGLKQNSPRKQLDFVDYAHQRLPSIELYSTKTQSKFEITASTKISQNTLRSQHQSFQNIVKKLEEHKNKCRKEIICSINTPNDDINEKRRNSSKVHISPTTPSLKNVVTSNSPQYMQNNNLNGSSLPKIPTENDDIGDNDQVFYKIRSNTIPELTEKERIAIKKYKKEMQEFLTQMQLNENKNKELVNSYKTDGDHTSVLIKKN